MKKSILIVSSSLGMGGLEKTLINLCDNINYNKYTVDLYLFNEGKQLLPSLNKNVNLLDDSPYYSDVYNKPLGASLKNLLKKRQFSLFFYRIGHFIRIRFNKRKQTVHDFNMQKKAMLKIDKNYDIAIGFEEGTASYYVANCINAKVKSCWMHTDVKAINNNKKLDEQAFSKVDYICTVSQNSLKSLTELYPKYTDKFRLFTLPALYDYDKLFEIAKEPNVMDKTTVNILSIGRLVELKGFQLCVGALKKLLDDGYNVKWYVAGEGDYRGNLQNLIEKYNVKENFILLGNYDNPYSLINSATICVQPSMYEGFSLVVYEEKLFKKPVVVSNIEPFLEQITHLKNGVVVERNSLDIYKGVKSLLDDKILLEKLANTPNNKYFTKEEMIKEIEKTFTK